MLVLVSELKHISRVLLVFLHNSSSQTLSYLWCRPQTQYCQLRSLNRSERSRLPWYRGAGSENMDRGTFTKVSEVANLKIIEAASPIVSEALS